MFCFPLQYELTANTIKHIGWPTTVVTCRREYSLIYNHSTINNDLCIFEHKCSCQGSLDRESKYHLFDFGVLHTVLIKYSGIDGSW